MKSLASVKEVIAAKEREQETLYSMLGCHLLKVEIRRATYVDVLSASMTAIVICLKSSLYKSNANVIRRISLFVFVNFRAKKW